MKRSFCKLRSGNSHWDTKKRRLEYYTVTPAMSSGPAASSEITKLKLQSYMCVCVHTCTCTHMLWRCTFNYRFHSLVIFIALRFAKSIISSLRNIMIQSQSERRKWVTNSQTNEWMNEWMNKPLAKYYCSNGVSTFILTPINPSSLVECLFHLNF